MRAKSKKSLAFAVLMALVSPAGAQTGAEACSTIAQMRPESVANGLRSFSGDVLGKPADMWGHQDYANLLANAAACDGKPDGVTNPVNAKHWSRVMKSAFEKMGPYFARTAAVRDAYSPHWTWGSPPSCLDVLSWKRDPIWLTENSEEVFGKAFSAMDSSGRAMSVGFSKECLPVMEAAVKASKTATAEAAAAIVEDIELAAARAEEASTENPEELAESLRVTHKGQRIPLAYISEASKKMVRFASDIEKRNVKLTTDQLIMLSKWAEKVTNERGQGPERLYADAVRKIIRKQMFHR